MLYKNQDIITIESLKDDQFIEIFLNRSESGNKLENKNFSNNLVMNEHE